jgi:hypothetical protein
MNKVRKLAILIILGGSLWIAGTYLLLLIFGNSKLIALFVFIGWLILAGYTLKYIELLRKDKATKSTDTNL